jgi:3-oxoadipate enol-lactonase
MQWIDVNGVSLRYELAGSGAKNIVLVHEMGGSLETWDDMFPTLAKPLARVGGAFL